MRIRSLVLALAWLAPALGAQAARADSARAAAAANDTGPLSLSREIFSYQGAGRDPFLSLLKSGDIRPLITDLKLVTIIYDERYAARSVAVLRDISTTKRYRVRTGDVLGRLRVTQIKPRDVVFTIQEFGFERQATLSLAKQEETP
ncbi:MAG: hypothetical protein ACM3OA_13240 [Acidobacteriota bacterium]|jgi:hypothetical protein